MENNKKRTREDFENNQTNYPEENLEDITSLPSNPIQETVDNLEKPQKIPKVTSPSQIQNQPQQPQQQQSQIQQSQQQPQQQQQPSTPQRLNQNQQFSPNQSPFAANFILSLLQGGAASGGIPNNQFLQLLTQMSPMNQQQKINPQPSQQSQQQQFMGGIQQQVTPSRPNSRRVPNSTPRRRKKKEEEEEEEEEELNEDGEPKEDTPRRRAKRLIKMSKDDLKKQCKDKGLILSGKKGELVQRLMHPENPLNKKNLAAAGILTARKVEQMLRNAGVENPKQTSQCLRAALQVGKIKLNKEDPLDTELCTEQCPECKQEITATVRDVLYQPDFGGNDFEQRQNATFKCPKCSRGWYVTKICMGEPTLDDGKKHHHCTKCPGFGICLSDYRQVHCTNCGEHHWYQSTCPFCGEEPEEPQSQQISDIQQTVFSMGN